MARLASGVATVLFLSLVVFVATQGLPSDPARVVLGPEAPEATVQILRHQLGLDLPIAQQFVRWLGAALTGDLGQSLSSRRVVSELVADRLGNTLALVAAVLGLTVPIALVVGVALARSAGSLVDRTVVSVLIGLKAVPVFALAIGLVLLLSTSVFSLLPAVSLLDSSRPLWVQLEYLALPVLTLVLSSAPYLTRLVRASMIEVLSTDYITQARLRGIPERRLIYRHAVPNALIPAIQGTALTTSVLLGGSLVVEVLFNYPGLGSLLNAAVEQRDLPIVQAAVLSISTGIVLINLLSDLLTLLLTPKLRTSAHARPAAGAMGASDASERPRTTAAAPSRP